TERALAGSTQKSLYQKVVCLANRPGSVISDFDLVFNESANLKIIQDTLDNNTRRPDGTYLFGDLQSNSPPSGRASTATTTAEPILITKVSTDRASRLFWEVTVPSIADKKSFTAAIPPTWVSLHRGRLKKGKSLERTVFTLLHPPLSSSDRAGPADPDHAVLHCKRKGLLLQGLQRQ
ncbi:unnamed protein product, partial [Darwinula stevensoni]